MKSGRHFNASESLDNLPLTHPEHFGTPVGSRRRGRVEEEEEESSSDEDEESNQPYSSRDNLSIIKLCFQQVLRRAIGVLIQLTAKSNELTK